MDSLPNELLHHICLMIALDRPHLLLPLCATSRRLNRIASPLLVYSWRHGRYTDPTPFIQHLLRHPEARTEIKKLTFRCITTEAAWTRTWSPWDAPMTSIAKPSKWAPQRLSDGDVACIAEEICYAFKDRSSFIRQVRLSISDAFLAVILMWSQSLQEFRLTIPTATNQGLVVLDVLNRAVTVDSPSPGSYYNLKSISLSGETSEDMADGVLIAPIFLLPSLKFLHLKWLTFENLGSVQDKSDTEPAFPCGTSKLQELTVKESRLSYRDLRVLLSACSDLRQLDLVWQNAFPESHSELVAMIPRSLESIKVSDQMLQRDMTKWLSLYDDLVVNAVLSGNNLQVVNFWDLLMHKKLCSKAYLDSFKEHGRDGKVALLIRDHDCDSVYTIHAARKCRCYWTPDKRQRYENRKRRGQI